MINLYKLTTYAVRFGLAASFLSASADRFGVWGESGTIGVVWGNFSNFINYTAVLNPWAPTALVPVLAWSATSLEILLGLLLIFGIRLEETALASSALLFIFAFSMSFTVGVKAPLDYSVFAASAAALALFSMVSLTKTKA